VRHRRLVCGPKGFSFCPSCDVLNVMAFAIGQLLNPRSESIGCLMALDLDSTHPAVDLGLSIRNSEATLGFYCGLLGLPHVSDMPMPVVDVGVMHRVQAGDTTLKFVKLENVPLTHVPGGPGTATGLRYLTIWVRNLHETVEVCRAAGHVIAVEPTVVRPGVTITMIEDPDGNWVELLQRDEQ
jgi:glyoxylase I family protein